MRSSTKIAIGFGVVVAGLWFGYQKIQDAMVMNIAFEPLQPGVVNLVGVNPGSDYYIVVANEMAQLVRGKNPEFSGRGSGAEETERKRIPIREMLLAMTGDTRALSFFVSSLNDISEDTLPIYPQVWSSADIQKAIDGDPELRERLERDLNVRLDGKPTEFVNPRAIEQGIVIESPVQVEVQVGAQRKTLTALVREHYHPRLAKNTYARFAEKVTVTPAMIQGYYIEEARKLLNDPAQREDIVRSLTAFFDPGRLRAMAEKPERVIASAQVIVNDRLIESATVEEVTLNDGKKDYDLLLRLTDEGRKRLWQFSRRNKGAQILIVWNGNAIAAPTIKGDLSGREVRITRIGNEDLARETAAAINENEGETQ